MRLYDAHNHLHDERLEPWRSELLDRVREVGVVRMVVNGSSERDWPDVIAAAKQSAMIVPSLGVHPWYVHERSANWQSSLVRWLEAVPSAIGEIGLDRWIVERRHRARCNVADLDEQAEVFVWQLRLAAERNLPASIHCLRAWGRLRAILETEPRPACGFLLHSYGGPAEMVRPFAELGAYFSLPGFFAHERKQRHRETFKQIPLDRWLIETDAPDQCLPDERNRFRLNDPDSGSPLNHPGNLPAVYEFAAELLGMNVNHLATRVEANFLRLFGRLNSASPSRDVDASNSSPLPT